MEESWAQNFHVRVIERKSSTVNCFLGLTCRREDALKVTIQNAPPKKFTAEEARALGNYGGSGGSGGSYDGGNENNADTESEYYATGPTGTPSAIDYYQNTQDIKDKYSSEIKDVEKKVKIKVVRKIKVIRKVKHS